MLIGYGTIARPTSIQIQLGEGDDRRDEPIDVLHTLEVFS
jgi:hypothetical protein